MGPSPERGNTAREDTAREDTLLREHFDLRRADTLVRMRPPGALAAQRSVRVRRRYRLVVSVATLVLSVVAAGGAFAAWDRPSPGHPVAASTHSTPSPASRPGTSVDATGTTAPGASAGANSSAPALPGPAGGPVPPGLRLESITFVSTSSAWALGYAPCLSPRAWSQCPAVVRSRDGGRTWAGVPAPGDAAYTGDIRFANARDGWVVVRAPLIAKDPGGASGVLYATHDGGATWQRVASVPAAAAVEAAAGRVSVTTGTEPAAGNAVYSAPTGVDSFAKVADGDGTGLVLHGHVAYVYGAGGTCCPSRTGPSAGAPFPATNSTGKARYSRRPGT